GALKPAYLRTLEDRYEQINASFGQFSHDTLTASTKALESTDDAKYTDDENAITNLTDTRNDLATHIKNALDAAPFSGTPTSQSQSDDWVNQANQLLSDAQALAASA